MVQQRDGFVSSLQQLMDLQEVPEEVKAAAYASLTDTMLLFNSKPHSTALTCTLLSVLTATVLCRRCLRHGLVQVERRRVAQRLCCSAAQYGSPLRWPW